MAGAMSAMFADLYVRFHEKLCITDHPPGTAGMPCAVANDTVEEWLHDTGFRPPVPTPERINRACHATGTGQCPRGVECDSGTCELARNVPPALTATPVGCPLHGHFRPMVSNGGMICGVVGCGRTFV